MTRSYSEVTVLRRPDGSIDTGRHIASGHLARSRAAGAMATGLAASLRRLAAATAGAASRLAGLGRATRPRPPRNVRSSPFRAAVGDVIEPMAPPGS